MDWKLIKDALPTVVRVYGTMVYTMAALQHLINIQSRKRFDWESEPFKWENAPFKLRAMDCVFVALVTAIAIGFALSIEYYKTLAIVVSYSQIVLCVLQDWVLSKLRTDVATDEMHLRYYKMMTDDFQITICTRFSWWMSRDILA